MKELSVSPVHLYTAISASADQLNTHSCQKEPPNGSQQRATSILTEMFNSIARLILRKAQVLK